MLPLIGAAAKVEQPKPLRQRKSIKIAWLPQAVCIAPVAAAKALGYFDQYNLDVELVGSDFHDDAFIRSPVEGRADAAVTMLHNWILPMANGLPVKLITPVHGGCVRIVGSRRAGITEIADLKGQRLGIPGGRVNSLATMVYSIILLRNGLVPGDVTFVPVENEDFGKAFAEGTITAAGGIDPPLLMLQERQPDLVEIASNTTGAMAGTSCCVVAAGPSLWRDDPLASLVLSAALARASDWAQAHPDEAAALFAQTSQLPQAAVRKSLAANNYHAHHVAGTPNGLAADVTSYAAVLKQIGLLPKTLDPVRFAAEHVDQAICA
ncbi:ABC transporter substrate-binding protein [Novosphingobium sp. BL-52-GroH]|uniref:ABC transporter substrate-binding protein n=1 Tax=Novosphingobium sp. BL-52-GroH TaxID=3349877 RepID=UPI00384E29C9